MTTSLPSKSLSKAEMRSTKNCILHGIYLAFYGLVKYSAWPFSNYIRYMIIRCLTSSIKTKSISDGVMIWFPWNVSISSSASLNQGVIIDGFGSVTIDDGVRIAPYVCINTADHNFSDRDTFIMDQGYTVAGVHIEKDVWIGAGSIINKGVRIGQGSVIGSGSVVTKDIPPYSVAVGIPCKKIADR